MNTSNRQRRHRRYSYGMGMHKLSIFTVAFCLSLISSLHCMDAKMLLVPKNQVRQGQGQGQASNTKTTSKNLKNNANANNSNNNKRNRKRNTRTSTSSTSTSRTNNHKNNTKQTNKKNKNKNKKGTMKQILLKPKPKKMSEASNENLKLEATIHTNENGEKVLKLTSESSQMVDNAMQIQNNSAQLQNTAQLQMKEIQFEPDQMQIEMDMDVEMKEEEPEVLFYDPEELKATSPGEPPALPKNVRDAAGNLVDMAGKHAILIPPHDHDHEDAEDDSVQNESNGGDSNTGSTTSNSSTSSSTTSEEASYVQTPQTQDQMIIISTVATMALFVGALSARRLRSRQFLSFCIENESLEDELAYDVAYTTQSTVGASSFYTGAGYDTFGGGKYGGDLRWRGDLEKFDV